MELLITLSSYYAIELLLITQAITLSDHHYVIKLTI